MHAPCIRRQVDTVHLAIGVPDDVQVLQPARRHLDQARSRNLRRGVDPLDERVSIVIRPGIHLRSSVILHAIHAGCVFRVWASIGLIADHPKCARPASDDSAKASFRQRRIEVETRQSRAAVFSLLEPDDGHKLDRLRTLDVPRSEIEIPAEVERSHPGRVRRVKGGGPKAAAGCAGLDERGGNRAAGQHVWRTECQQHNCQADDNE